MAPPRRPSVDCRPTSTYTFTVFAYNGQGCTASAPVRATPRAAPGQVVLQPGNVSGLEPHGDGMWDFRLLGVTIPSGSADVDSVVYRLSGGTTDGSESTLPLSTGGFLTAGASHYGNDISVQVKACRQYTEVRLCSPDWSPAYALGKPVEHPAQRPGGHRDQAPADGPRSRTGILGVDGGPAVGAPGYDSVSYTCGSADTSPDDQLCEVVGEGLLGAAYADLVVTVSANGTTFTRTFTWADAPH